jgi:hypothetical protein
VIVDLDTLGQLKAMKAISSILLILALVLTALAGAVLSGKPQAVPAEGGAVKVQWKTLDETGVSRFDVLRSQVVRGDITSFASATGEIGIAAKGIASDYTFTDISVFKTTSNIFVYKVRVYFQNGTFSDSEISDRTTNGLSSASKRTWGSIKAMFR